MRQLALLGVLLLLFLPLSNALADGTEATAADEHKAEEHNGKSDSPWSSGLGYLAAALAVGMGSIGAGLAVASTASAAVGAVAEREEVAGKALVFVGLAEGIAIYGLVIAIMILNKL